MSCKSEFDQRPLVSVHSWVRPTVHRTETFPFLVPRLLVVVVNFKTQGSMWNSLAPCVIDLRKYYSACVFYQVASDFTCDPSPNSGSERQQWILLLCSLVCCSVTILPQARAVHLSAWRSEQVWVCAPLHRDKQMFILFSAPRSQIYLRAHPTFASSKVFFDWGASRIEKVFSEGATCGVVFINSKDAV